MNEREKKSIISELISLGKVDGHVHEDEIGLIKQMGNMIGLSDEIILDLFKNPVPYDPPTDAMERILQFHRLVLLMNVDVNVSPHEIQHVKLMGIRLGLDPDAIEEVLQTMVKYENNVIPPDVLMAIYIKNLN